MRLVMFDEAFMTVDEYRAGHEARMRDARALQERNLADRERAFNPPPPPPPPPEPPYDMTIDLIPMAERTPLQRLLSARFALQKALGAVLKEEDENGSKIYALKKRQAKLNEKSARQSEWLKVLNEKIAEASK